jgi:hypothetical protein
MQELEERNKAWPEAKCQGLGAMWLLVVDGQSLETTGFEPVEAHF